eukprot:53441-Alexandrium_andersonii.AAC.1
MHGDPAGTTRRTGSTCLNWADPGTRAATLASPSTTAGSHLEDGQSQHVPSRALRGTCGGGTRGPDA